MPGRFQRNVDALATMNQLGMGYESNGRVTMERSVTRDECDVLRQYTGWGDSNVAKQLWGYDNVSHETREAHIDARFGRYDSEIQKRFQLEHYHPVLREALSDNIETLDALRHSTLNAHYTPEDVWRRIWSHLDALGALAPIMARRDARILEPSAGIGTAVSTAPEWVQSRVAAGDASWTCVELEPLTAKLCKAMHPEANVYACGIQDAPLPPASFDLVVSNVPFGNYGVKDASIDARMCTAIHDYFFAKALQLVKIGGCVAFVTSHFTFNKVSQNVRRYIAKHARLLDLVMLPSSMFKENAGTEVVTCVAFLQRMPVNQLATVANDNDDSIDSALDELHRLKKHSWYEFKKMFKNPYADDETLALQLIEMWRKQRGAAGDTSVASDTAPEWVKTTQMEFANPRYSSGPKVTHHVSNWFTRADRVLGTMDASGTMYGGAPGFNVTCDRSDALAQWDSVIQSVAGDPSMHVSSIASIVSDDSRDTIAATPAPVAPIASAPEDPRYPGLMRIFDAAKELLKDQIDGCDTTEAMKQLNESYDVFVFQYGPLTRPLKRGKTNLSVLSDQGVAQFLESLETPEFKKSPIFSRCVIGADRSIVAQSPSDALYQSLDRFGRVDLHWMAQQLQSTPDEVLEALGDSVFLTHSGWSGINDSTPHDPYECVTSDEYLSGDTVSRLASARRWAALAPGRYQRNVEALLNHQPPPVPAESIMVRLGSPWVPSDIVSTFVEHVTGEWGSPVRYSNGTWDLHDIRSIHHHRKCTVPIESLCTSRTTLTQVFMSALNGTQIEVWDRFEDGTSAKNVAMTTLGNACVAVLQREFRAWVWTDEARKARLVRVYNETYNTIVPRRFNGDHLTFPGLSATFAPRWYQRAAVARILSIRPGQSDQVCITHRVGFGKTASALIAARKSLQIGACRRVLILCKKSIRPTWIAALRALYPGYLDRVKVCDGDDFGKGRTRFAGEIVSGKYDIIVATYEQFQKFPMSPETVQQFIKQERDALELMMFEDRAAGVRDDKRDKSTKQFEKALLKMMERLQKSSDVIKRDTRDYLTYESLGCDMVIADEAHVWKRDIVQTKITGVKGLNTTQMSQRAVDARIKCQWSLNRGYRWIELTGTPVSNSIVETFVVQRRLQSQLLKAKGIDSFDTWSGVFTESHDTLERDATGEYKHVRRLIFHNLPELNAMLGESWDRVDSIEATTTRDTGAALVIPELHGGKIEVIETIATAGLCAFTRDLAERKKSLKGGDKKRDNHLLIDGDGRKSAYVNGDPYAPWDPNRITKINALVDKVLQMHEMYQAQQGVQAIFCDMFTPDTCAPIASYESEAHVFQKEGLYGVIRWRLVNRGVAESDIAYIHEAEDDDDTEELESQLNEGSKRIIIGSTGRMGEGKNIQTRLVALHHVDCPWRPSDLEQRNGRILRHGNQFKHVHIFAYVTQQSYDIVAWQIVKAKSLFLQQISAGSISQRSAEDVGDITVTAEMAMALAAGDRRIVIRSDLEGKVRLASLQYHEWQSSNRRVTGRLKSLPHEIQRCKRSIEAMRDFAATCDTIATHGATAALAAQFGYRVKDAQKLYATWSLACVSGDTATCGPLSLTCSPAPDDASRITLVLTHTVTRLAVRQEIHKKPGEAFEWLATVLRDPRARLALLERDLGALEAELTSLSSVPVATEWAGMDQVKQVYIDYLSLCADLEMQAEAVEPDFASETSESLLSQLAEIEKKRQEEQARLAQLDLQRGARVEDSDE
jgi:N12 class adenine-specific DNA methylase